MYLDHFGLNEPPFKITPHIEFFFPGASRGPVLEGLLYAIQNGEGLIKVVGEVGTGKTMLSRVVIERLPKTVQCVLINTPAISPEDILALVAEELGIDITGQRHASIIRAIQECLIQRYASGHQVVLFIDEAHAMPQATLEEIRLLSNLESSTHKLLQIVLFGQPELDELLARAEMRQLRERVTHSFTLGPMRQEEVGKYLDFRLRAAGYRGPQLFTKGPTTRITTASHGLTRRINILADKSLLAAFADNTHTLTDAHVNAAIRDSEFGHDPTPPQTAASQQLSRTRSLAAAIAITATLSIGLTYLTMRLSNTPTPASNNEQPPPGLPPASTPSLKHGKLQKPPSFNSRTEEKLFSGTELLRSDKQSYTILLSVTNGRPNPALEDFLSRPPVSSEKLFLYELTLKGATRIAVIYDTFPSRAAAQKALESLPEEVLRHQPYVRSLNSIREEIKPTPSKIT